MNRKVFELSNPITVPFICDAHNGSLSSLREDKARLKYHILSNRAVKERLAPIDQNNTVHLRVYFYCYQVLTTAEAEQSFTSYNYFQMSWGDPDLRWDPVDFGGLKLLSLPYDDLWHPEVIVTNFADQDFMMVEPKNKYLIVHNDGLVKIVTPVYLKTTCSLDLTFYPFDIQECEIRLYPFFNDGQTEIIEASEKTTPVLFNLQSEWTIVSREVILSQYGNETDHVPIVRAKILLHRQHLFYVVTVVGPLVLTLILMSFVFCIPPGSADRVSYLVTVLLSNAVFLNFIAGTIPKSFTLSNVPRFVIFLSGVMMESFFALLANLFVLWRYNIEQQKAQQPPNDSTSYQQMRTKTHIDSNRLQPIRSELMTHNVATIHQRVTNDAMGKLRSFLGNWLRKKTPVVSAEQSDVKINETVQMDQVKWRRHITSREWDLIFFIVYHVISVPCYLQFFIYNLSQEDRTFNTNSMDNQKKLGEEIFVLSSCENNTNLLKYVVGETMARAHTGFVSNISKSNRVTAIGAVVEEHVARAAVGRHAEPASSGTQSLHHPARRACIIRHAGPASFGTQSAHHSAHGTCIISRPRKNNITSEKTTPDPFNLQSEWTIVSREVILSRYGNETDHVPIVRAKILLHRKHLFYVVTVVGPLVLTLILMSFVFCIPPGSADRMSYLVTVLLSNAVFLNFIAGTIPKSFTLSNVPRFVIFLSGVIMESFFALLANLFVLWTYNVEQQKAQQNPSDSTSYQQMRTKTHLDGSRLQPIRSELMTHNAATIHQRVTNDAMGKLRSFLENWLRKNTSVVSAEESDVKIDETRQIDQVKWRRHITSREWDVIFFIVYHVISVPCYLQFFIHK
ncbi:hypothetical protein Btru_021307 [Bulinus truncatus]|nr:hypothetical protein Btru_021307 [Bulinus truncatus]